MPDEVLHCRLGSLVDGYAPASREALASYAVEGVVPSAVVAPGSLESLAATVQMASELGYAVIPRGGGTKMDFGHPPSRADIVVSLERLNRIVAHEPADQTATVEAGITMAGLQAGLGERGQYLPLDPPHGDAGTLGGVLATNASGVLRTAFGTARDLVIGARVVQADGTVVRSGGQVVKNVAGYDLNKMYIGSLGTLGILAEVNLKLQPLPASGRLLIGTMAGIGEAAECAFRVMDSEVMPSFLEVASPATCTLLAGNGTLRDDRDFAVVAGMIGTDETVDWQAGECERIFRDSGAAAVKTVDGDGYRRVLDGLRAFPGGGLLPQGMGPGVTCRAGVTPDGVEALFRLADEGCRRLSIGCGLLSHFASGHVAFVFYRDGTFRESDYDGLASLIETLRNASEEQGVFVVEHAPAALKERVGVWGSTRGNRHIMEVLKNRFDPKGTLNPGRFVDGI
ncbi:MAG: FAD-binding oxidoreductase [Gemmatimonadetes bacterium]|nr:FAD-binding oxidoreductase [Gemmatimonadota bacterium]MYG84936.1 FAD-binding oxidoreductase [Gemmatimonadota bacterium]MYJ90522.1 FAD-binding oxidoreductase [Gemmatimonadota bacterium]